MYSVFDLGDTNTSREKKNLIRHCEPVKLRSTSIRKSPAIERSRAGCVNCKKRRRKCDERHPICGFCKDKGAECTWQIKEYIPLGLEQDPKFSKNTTRNSSGIVAKTTIDKSKLPYISHLQTSPYIQDTGSQILEDLGDLALSLNPFELVKNADEITTPASFDFDTLIPSLIKPPSSTFSIYLDDRGLGFLEYFEKRVAKMLCVSPASSNYFLKTFFAMSASDESILNALAAWGCVFSEGPESALVSQYLSRATSMINMTFIGLDKNDKYSYFVIFCYYLIAIGIHVSSGDTLEWYSLFNQCANLLRQYGGISKLLQDFQYSNDVKWLVSNFQFHDIMSSMTLSNGTSCSMKMYNDIFSTNKLLDKPDYGVDPNQGCIQPIFLLLGEIMNTSANLKKLRQHIDSMLDSFEIRDPDLIRQRLLHFKNVESKYNELNRSIENCTPNEVQLSLLEPEESKHHLELFGLYQSVCKIYALLYIKQTQPKSSEVQSLVVTSLTLIESLLKTSVASSLKMALLICGMSCCKSYDRRTMSEILQRFCDVYHVGNIKRLWDVIAISWRKNPTGDLCMDWVDICDELGWKLSVC
ncbi:uncharacterized protein PRCAT00003190001 [Priceomyces carsonii]|uniref:uncharacterized protein n=1 Tax=Priceomyces carsonii TaxID=28549 RepID=UPI002EDAC658|nr:unnamed protein product [Priceomyces carsonii]